MSAASVALVAPEHPALGSLIGQPLPPAKLLVRLARCGLDLMPRRSDAALLSRTSKACPVQNFTEAKACLAKLLSAVRPRPHAALMPGVSSAPPHFLSPPLVAPLHPATSL